MRHRRAGIKLGRTASHRKAMFRNMVTSLFKYDEIRTTEVKAKEIRRWADQLVTLAKRGDLHARRQAMAIIQEKDVVHKLFDEAPQRFADISGGYTRVVKAGYRPGDAAPISLVQLVSPEPKKKKKTRRKKKGVAETPQAALTETAVSEEAAKAAPGSQAAESPAEEVEAQAPEAVASEAATETPKEAPEAAEKQDEK